MIFGLPCDDWNIIYAFMSILGAFILARNYFSISAKTAALEGRLQFGGNSFDVKNKIISKCNAWIGFSIILIAVVAPIFMQKANVCADSLDSVLLSSKLNLVRLLFAGTLLGV